jgi:hypothetical protein
MNAAVIRISEAMVELGIERIVYLPASDLVPRDTFNCHLIGSGYVGNGLNVGEAYEQACVKARRRAA